MDTEAQSRGFFRASTDVANTAFSQSSQPHAPFSQLALAIQNLNGNTILVMVPVQKAANGEQAWTRIRELARQASIAHQLEDWTQGIFTKQAVGTAKIQQAAPCDDTNSLWYFRISLHEHKHDTLFTQALKHPGLLSRQRDYISCNERFTVQTPTTTDLNGQNVIVVYRVLDRVKITWLLILLLFVSPGLGVLVGLRSHKAEVGIAVSAGVFALASFFQGLAAWMHS